MAACEPEEADMRQPGLVADVQWLAGSQRRSSEAGFDDVIDDLNKPPAE